MMELNAMPQPSRFLRGNSCPSPRHPASSPTRWRIGLVFLLFLHTGCACYRAGCDTLYPADIKTVYVPVIRSKSFRPFLGERLTEAVVKEIDEKTPFKVVTANADSVLMGEILGETKRILVESPTDEPREVEVNFNVSVTWTDSRGEVLRATQVIPVPASLVDVQQSAGVVPEVGQSISTQQQKAIEQLAEQIVALMEAPW
jgi:hypothetical protein